MVVVPTSSVILPDLQNRNSHYRGIPVLLAAPTMPMELVEFVVVAAVTVAVSVHMDLLVVLA